MDVPGDRAGAGVQVDRCDAWGSFSNRGSSEGVGARLECTLSSLAMIRDDH